MLACVTCVNLKTELNIDLVNRRHTCRRMVMNPVNGVEEPLDRLAMAERTSDHPESCGKDAQFHEMVI